MLPASAPLYTARECIKSQCSPEEQRAGERGETESREAEGTENQPVPPVVLSWPCCCCGFSHWWAMAIAVITAIIVAIATIAP
jgi:hypothetical protein